MDKFSSNILAGIIENRRADLNLLEEHLAREQWRPALTVAERCGGYLLRAVVFQAREHGATWSVVAAQLGISKQAAQQRFGTPVAGVIEVSGR
jgi:hypothetical protein